MKKRTSRRVACERDNSHFLRYVVIAPAVEIDRRILVRSITLIALEVFRYYLVEMKRRTCRRVACKRDDVHFFRYVVIFPESEIFFFFFFFSVT